MKLTVLDSQHRPALEAFLELHIESSLFLRSNLAAVGLKDTGKRFEGTYVGAFEGDALVAVAAHYWNGNIITQTPVYTAELVQFLSRQSDRVIAGFLGPWSQTQAALVTLNINPDTLLRSCREVLYALPLADLVMPSTRPDQNVSARPAVLDDLDLLSDWRIAYNAETMNIQPDESRRLQVHKNLTHAIDSERIFVLEDHGKLVSMTGLNAQLPNTVQIGGVWTPPKLRSRGYARQLVARHLNQLRTASVEKAILFTEEENRPARAVYESLGFSQIGDYAILIMSEPNG